MITNILRYGVIILIFFVLALLQASFLPYFNILGAIPGLVFILFFLLLFFQREREFRQDFLGAIVAGFLMDMYSSFPFGFHIASLIAICLINTGADYFVKDSQGKHQLLYFTGFFAFYFAVNQALLFGFLRIFGMDFHFDTVTIFITLAYSLPFAIIGFYGYKKLANQVVQDSQLKLFN